MTPVKAGNDREPDFRQARITPHRPGSMGRGRSDRYALTSYGAFSRLANRLAKRFATMATIKDIARAARVSVATVSAVANGTKFVSEPLARRVRRAIDATGYQPHGVARSLKNGTTQTLGLIVTDITNPFFTAVARSVEDAAHLAGYAVVLCNSDEDVDKERLYLELMRRRRVDGLIWAPGGRHCQLPGPPCRSTRADDRCSTARSTACRWMASSSTTSARPVRRSST